MIGRRNFLKGVGAAATASLVPASLLAAARARLPAPARLDSWSAVRSQFRLSASFVHMTCFHLVSHPLPVRDAIKGFRRALDDNPYLAVDHAKWGSPGENLEMAVRDEVAAYTGGSAANVALTGNTTAGLSLVYNGLQLQPGDEILTTTHDHSSHHYSIFWSTQRNGASVRRIALFDQSTHANDDEILARIAAAIRPRTRVLGITWVQSKTGVRVPVRRIADLVASINSSRGESSRLLLVVDGVHGLGALADQVASLGSDFFIAGTHKWIFAPRGTGIIWAPEGNWPLLRPVVHSFSDSELGRALREERPLATPNNAGRSTPGGYHAYEHQWGMAAAFRMQGQIGRERAAVRIAELNTRIKRGLVSIRGITLHTPVDPGLSAGICCFQMRGKESADAARALLDHGVIASPSPYAPSLLRLAGGLINDEGDIDLALEAVEAVARTA